MTAEHIVVLPGGGYQTHAPHEAEPVAAWLQNLGIAASVFRYPLHTPHPGPLHAVRSEIARLRAEGATRIGVLGFSAGGHLAGLAAFSPGGSAEQRADAAILGYPVVTMTPATPNRIRSIVLGDPPSETLVSETSLEQLVNPLSPPVFVWHTAADQTISAGQTHLLGQALATEGVSHETHVFARGPHGLGLADAPDAGAASAWTSLCAEWLLTHGWSISTPGAIRHRGPS
ncbi:MAG TPA: alpha/beta hydrolase [Actinospica sp.]|nr:alpha/beta hydrolase [Actinospica sp.]